MKGVAHGVVVRAQRFQHAQPVFPDIDARAGSAQRRLAFVDGNVPAALGECRGGGKSTQAAAGDDCRQSLVHVFSSKGS
ncbi:hypothetical protein D3C87_2086410 [compost metagenome]